MGSYGIGLGRCMAAIAQQNNDENGLIWPMNVAPYKVAIVIISNKDETQVKIANELYDFLKQNHIDVILDDREERPGVKFKDMDLIGIPLRVTIGKKAVENIVEFKERTKADREELTLEEVKAKIIELVNE